MTYKVMKLDWDSSKHWDDDFTSFTVGTNLGTYLIKIDDGFAVSVFELEQYGILLLQPA